jgi:D-alanine-D-alanine ligase
MILRQRDLFVLEVNTIPGMTEMSLCPQQARAAGMTFGDLLDRMIDLALRRKGAGTRAVESSRGS